MGARSGFHAAAPPAQFWEMQPVAVGRVVWVGFGFRSLAVEVGSLAGAGSLAVGDRRRAVVVTAGLRAGYPEPGCLEPTATSLPTR